MSRTAESCCERLDLRPPRGMAARFHRRQQPLQNFAQVADQRHVYRHVLVDFGPIDLHVNFLGLHRVGIELAGHPVVEAHTQSNQQIGTLE